MSLFVLSIVLVPVVIAWALTGPLLSALGQPAQIVHDASYFALVMMVCLPARIGVSQISSFFTSMRIMQPGMLTSVLAMISNLSLGLFFVLGFPVKGWSGFGFVACPIVTSTVEYMQLLVLWGVYWAALKLYKDYWPEDGWSMKYITTARIYEFSKVRKIIRLKI